MDSDEILLATLVSEQMGRHPESIQPIRAHGSARRIYRIHLTATETAVGIVNDAIRENAAFKSFARSFRGIGLAVPEILAENIDTAYVESDLGNTTLLDRLGSGRDGADVTAAIQTLYRQALDDLVVFQSKGFQVIDRSLCYEGERFDAAAIERDIKYFAGEYLARVGLLSAGESLETDIQELSNVGGTYESGHFMFRDFQSRNIMIHQNTLFYIDFQSGREGPLQYDVASLLFQSQANLPFPLRESLLDHYIRSAKTAMSVDESQFKDRFLVYVLIRALQNLGAYGRLGLGQGKRYFIDSIPFALENCRYLLNHWPRSVECNALKGKIEQAVDLASRKPL